MRCRLHISYMAVTGHFPGISRLLLSAVPISRIREPKTMFSITEAETIQLVLCGLDFCFSPHFLASGKNAFGTSSMPLWSCFIFACLPSLLPEVKASLKDWIKSVSNITWVLLKSPR